jgi:hypothetical protein
MAREIELPIDQVGDRQVCDRARVDHGASIFTRAQQRSSISNDKPFGMRTRITVRQMDSCVDTRQRLSVEMRCAT